MEQPSSHSHQQPLFNQPVVRSKMTTFHSRMAALQVSTCVTCMERFPGMTVTVTPAGTRCARCNRDQHSPKAFSCENNLDAGPLPPELMVSCMCNVALNLLGFSPTLGHCYYLIVYRGCLKWRRCLSLQ